MGFELWPKGITGELGEEWKVTLTQCLPNILCCGTEAVICSVPGSKPVRWGGKAGGGCHTSRTYLKITSHPSGNLPSRGRKSCWWEDVSCETLCNKTN